MKNPAKVGYVETLEVRDTCMCMHIQRGARALARKFDEVFSPLNLTHGQFSLLMSLNRPVPATMSSVADLLGMDRTSLTAKLKPLERRSLIKTLVDHSDRRNRHVVLTATGQQLISEAYPIWKATHTALNNIIGELDQKKLRATMNSLTRGI